VVRRAPPLFHPHHSVQSVAGHGNHQTAVIEQTAVEVQDNGKKQVALSTAQEIRNVSYPPHNNLAILPQKRSQSEGAIEVVANQHSEAKRPALAKNDKQEDTLFDLGGIGAKDSVPILDRIISQSSDKTDRSDSPVAETNATLAMAHPDAVISADDGTMWACSICRSATFLSYDECVKHEDTCTPELDEMKKELERLRQRNEYLEERNSELAGQNKYLLKANIELKEKLQEGGLG